MDSYFEQQAASWDTPARIRRARRIAQEIRLRAGVARCRVAMELGSGTGLVGFALADCAQTLILSDPSAAMCAVLRAKAAAYRGPAAVRVCQAPPGRLPDPPAPCGLIFHSMALHHVRDLGAALRQSCQMLAPGGCLCFVDMEPVSRAFHADHPDFAGYDGFDQAALRAALEDAGFSGVRSAAFLRDQKVIDGHAHPFTLFWMRGTKP